jgi:hypothetical protein
METEYGQYVGTMYEKGYYVIDYSITITSDEVSCFGNKILINPIISENDRFVYIFTGVAQKKIIPGEITEFKLYLEDGKGEFKDNDNIMLSVGVINGTPIDLYTRSYSQWKFGVQFDKGIYMESERFLIFQAQKEIIKFDVEINNIDLFVYKYKKKSDDFNRDMMWID